MTADFEFVIERRQGFVANLTLNDPDRRNALTDSMVAALCSKLRLAAEDTDLRAIVLRGAGKSFCAGADLAATISRLEAGEQGRSEIIRVNLEAGALFECLASSPLCTIAVIDGAAMGGGLGLAACADVVLATRAANFSLSETTLGLIPGQIAPHVASRIGSRRAIRLALTSARLNAQDAKLEGIVDEAFESIESLEAHLTEILVGVGRCARGANSATKKIFREADKSDFGASARERAAKAFLARLEDPEGREGISAFVKKRRPIWDAYND